MDAVVNRPSGGLAAGQRPVTAPVDGRDHVAAVEKGRINDRGKTGVQRVEIDRSGSLVLVQAHAIDDRRTLNFLGHLGWPFALALVVLRIGERNFTLGSINKKHVHDVGGKKAEREIGLGSEDNELA